jgi:hypothetical protein
MLLSATVYAAPEIIAPACANPAPLHGTWNEKTPGYIVAIGSSWIPKFLRVSVLEWRYGFDADRTFDGTLFVSEVAPPDLAELRCDRMVRYIEFNMPTRLLDSNQSTQ